MKKYPACMLSFILLFFWGFVANAGATSLLLNPTDDVSIYEGNPDKNYNDGTYLENQLYINGNGADYRSLLKFKLPDELDIATIVDISFGFYVQYEGANYISLLQMGTDSWDESSVTWNSYSSFFGSNTYLGQIYTHNAPDNGNNGLVSIDLSSMDLSDDLLDNYLTFMLTPQGTNWATLYSSETQYKPYLEIEYNAAQTPEPSAMILFGFGLLGLAGVRRRK